MRFIEEINILLECLEQVTFTCAVKSLLLIHTSLLFSSVNTLADNNGFRTGAKSYVMIVNKLYSLSFCIPNVVFVLMIQ